MKNLIRAFEGPLTSEVVLSPGEFGLGKVPARLRPERTTSMVCGYCSTGCSLNVHLKGGAAVNLTPDTEYPVNQGMACPKGWESLAPLGAEDRATRPILDGAEVDWHTAMEAFCERFKGIQQAHGNGAVAFLSTGQICTEEMAMLGSLAKFGMGMLHGDGNTRQCMATSVVAYKESFGFDAPPYTYQDFEESDVIVLIGSNLCITHPIMWQRVLANRRSPEIVVIDPRRTETAMQATRHVPLAPKSDLVLFYGLARLLIERGWIDAEFIAQHTSGFDEFARHVDAFTLAETGARTGLAEAEIEALAAAIGSGKRVSFWWTMGVNQGHEAVRTAQAIINLALMTGNIGKPGTGANSITGQCNAMGSRLFSNTTNLLGGRDFTDAGHREEVAQRLGIDVERIPASPSMSYDQILDAIDRGEIRGLWIVATNTAHSWINRGRIAELFEKLDFLVVQDMYHSTETAQLADLVLPAAAWGEKDGTFINSERRVGLVKKVARAPGEALADFSIFKLVASYWGCAQLFESWRDPEAVFGLLAELSRGRPCDMSGIESYRMLDEAGGIQWPLPRGGGAAASQRRLFEDGRFYHADGRARFVFADPQPMPEPVDDKFPFLLLTGRGSSAQWHTQTRTGKSAILRKLHPGELLVEINPADADRLGIQRGDRIAVASRRGEIEAPAFITRRVQPGQVFAAMHESLANLLTHPSFDPHSRQPNYKACAVRVERRRG